MSITDPLKQRRAIRRIHRALRRDPYNVESLLELANRLEAGSEPDRKERRDVLHRILALEPGNRQARAMLFEMDRAEIGGGASRLSQAVILTSPSASDFPEPPLVLRYSFVHQILVYLLVASTVLAGVSVGRDAGGLVVFGGLLFLLTIPLWFISAVIEIGDRGIGVSRLFGIARSEIRWRDIREVRASILGQGIIILSRKGKALEVSAHIHGYAFILDIMRQNRADLFNDLELSTIENIPQKNAVLPSVVAKPFQ